MLLSIFKILNKYYTDNIHKYCHYFLCRISSRIQIFILNFSKLRVMKGSTGRFWRKSYTTEYTTFFPSPFMFLFRGFSHFFHLATVVFLVYDWFSPLPLFSSFHPELSFVQVSKRHPEKLDTEFTTHRRGFEPESWHFCSQLR